MCHKTAGQRTGKVETSSSEDFKKVKAVSKGFSFWGREAYPYLSLPMGLSLNSDNETYENHMALVGGVTGPMPIQGFEKYTANLETRINLAHSFTSVFLGFGYPFE